MKCMTCDKGTLRAGENEEKLYGISLGRFPALLCDSCGQNYTDGDTMRKIEKAAQRMGLWGLGQRITIRRSGNSLAVHIPKKIANYLKLKPGMDALIHPEGKSLVIEME